MTRAVFLIILALLFWTDSMAVADKSHPAHPVTVTAEVDSISVHIGDRIRYTIKVKASKDFEVQMPSFGDNLADFAIKEFDSDESGFFSKTYTQSYILDIYETGEFTIPAAIIKYRNGSTSGWEEVITEGISITVQSLLNKTDHTTAPRDIRGPHSINNLKYLYIAIAVIAIIAIAIAVFMFLKRRKEIETTTSPLPPAHETALKSLKELMSKDYIGKGKIQEYYYELSNIVRHYLEDRFYLKAPEMTTEEFLVHLKYTDKLNSSHKSLLQEFLSQCDMVKFAKHLPEQQEILSSYGSAQRLVEQTKEIFVTGDKIK
jgi:hypothetical protein